MKRISIHNDPEQPTAGLNISARNARRSFPFEYPFYTRIYINHPIIRFWVEKRQTRTPGLIQTGDPPAVAKKEEWIYNYERVYEGVSDHIQAWACQGISVGLELRTLMLR